MPASSARKLKQLITEGFISGGYGIYLGPTPLRDESIEILPVEDFLVHLSAGEILPA